MKNNGLDRRDFLRLTAFSGAALAAAASFPSFSWANVKQVTLKECLAMSPEDMAKNSKLVTDSMDYIRMAVGTIRNEDLRNKVAGILDNPAPTFMKNLKDESNKKAVYDKLMAEKLLVDVAFNDFLPPIASPDKSPQPFLSAPGSGYQSHHSYPGGVVTHTALNTKVSLSIYEGYKEIYGYELDRDVVIASQVLHDLHKPWVFQWGPSGESRTERPLGGTGEHHPYSVAESIYRGLPAEACVAQACAHNHPGWPNDEQGPVNWIKSASVLLGIDPVEKGLLDSSMKTLPLPRKMEGFVCHLGDHDWILTVPAAKWIIPVLMEVAAEKYGIKVSGEKDMRKLQPGDAENEKQFNALRNYVFSQTTIMTLYNLYSTKGKDALTEAVTKVVAPV